MVRSDELVTGGIAGISSSNSMSGLSSTADVSGYEFAGGLIGSATKTTIQGSYAAGDVSGGYYVGGISGIVDGSTIVDSFASGNVTATLSSGWAGGLIGNVLTDSGDSEVRNSYAFGKVEGATSGGLVGISSNAVKVTNAYWNVSANPGLRTIGSEPGDAEGRTDVELKKKITFTGWDFDGVWGIMEDQSTPYLLEFKPELELDPPAGSGMPVYSAVNGYNRITVTGRFLDPSIGEMLELGYAVKDDLGATVAQGVHGSVMATLHAQPMALELMVTAGGPLDLPDGDYALEISVADTVAGSDPAHRKTAVFPFTVDRPPPIIALIGDSTITITAGDTYTELGAIATDDRGGVVTSRIVITGTVDSDVPGTYTLTYSVRDNVGNEAAIVRKVVVASPPDSDSGDQPADPGPGDQPSDPGNQPPASNPGYIPRVAASTSDNNGLESLKLLDGSIEIELTPPSSATKLRYAAVTAKERLTIVVKPEHPAASVTVNGEPVPEGERLVTLEDGDNTFTIEVRAENGAVRTYTLTIRRTTAEAEPEPTTPACPFVDVRGHWAGAIICEAFARGSAPGRFGQPLCAGSASHKAGTGGHAGPRGARPDAGRRAAGRAADGRGDRAIRRRALDISMGKRRCGAHGDTRLDAAKRRRPLRSACERDESGSGGDDFAAVEDASPVNEKNVGAALPYKGDAAPYSISVSRRHAIQHSQNQYNGFSTGHMAARSKPVAGPSLDDARIRGCRNGRVSPHRHLICIIIGQRWACLLLVFVSYYAHQHDRDLGAGHPLQRSECPVVVSSRPSGGGRLHDMGFRVPRNALLILEGPDLVQRSGQRERS